MKRLFIFLLLLPMMGFCTNHVNVRVETPHYSLTQDHPLIQYHRNSAPRRFHGHDTHPPVREHGVHGHRPGKDINVHQHRNIVESHPQPHIKPGDNHNQNQQAYQDQHQNHGHD